MPRGISALTVLIAVGLAPVRSLAADPAPSGGAEEVLRAKGLLFLGGVFALPDEAELARKLREVRPHQKKIQDAARQLETAERKEIDQERLLDQYARERRLLGQRLSQPSLDVDQHNKMVARLHQLTVMIQELHDKGRENKEAKDARAALGRAREGYLGLLVDARKVVESVRKRYEELKSDPEVTAALAELAKGADKSSASLGPTRSFERNVASLDRLEASIHSETIELRPESGTFWVEAILNGKYPRAMVFDTGASLVSVPAALAAEIGLEPSDEDPTIRLSLADGRTVSAKLMKIDSIRLGPFTVEGVECAVLPSQLRDAPPLLGGSFLRHFTYRIEPESQRLTLSQIEAVGPSTKKPAAPKSTKRRKSN